MSWNYRLVTYTQEYTLGGKEKQVRLYGITDVYYDEEGTPNGYKAPSATNPITDWEELDDLKNTLPLLQGALGKPIIDLDNFPQEYKVDETERTD